MRGCTFPAIALKPCWIWSPDISTYAYVICILFSHHPDPIDFESVLLPRPTFLSWDVEFCHDAGTKAPRHLLFTRNTIGSLPCGSGGNPYTPNLAPAGRVRDVDSYVDRQTTQKSSNNGAVRPRPLHTEVPTKRGKAAPPHRAASDHGRARTILQSCVTGSDGDPSHQDRGTTWSCNACSLKRTGMPSPDGREVLGSSPKAKGRGTLSFE